MGFLNTQRDQNRVALYYNIRQLLYFLALYLDELNDNYRVKKLIYLINH